MKPRLTVLRPDLWNPPKGAGDLVAMVAQPIAVAIDAVAGTNLKKCKGCSDRREALNKAMPFGSG